MMRKWDYPMKACTWHSLGRYPWWFCMPGKRRT